MSHFTADDDQEQQSRLREVDEQPSRAMTPRRAEHWRWAVDALLATSVLLVVGLVEYGIIPNQKAGFYCGDPKISFPFQGDTISAAILLSGTFLIPFIVIWLVESCCLPPDKQHKCSCVKDVAVAGLCRSLVWYRGFLVGLAVVFLVTEVGKVVMGEPRPHFLYTCQPDLAVGCTPGSYVANYVCTNKEDFFWDVDDATKSFPSGHSSASFFMSVFLMWFVQARIPGDVTYLLVPWLHCVFSTWCLVCAITRITDHRHHWWDVLAGSALGIVGAVLTVKLLCGGFLKRNNRRMQRKIEDSTFENGHV